jgi:hypothetical protein
MPSAANQVKPTSHFIRVTIHSRDQLSCLNPSFQLNILRHKTHTWCLLATWLRNSTTRSHNIQLPYLIRRLPQKTKFQIANKFQKRVVTDTMTTRFQKTWHRQFLKKKRIPLKLRVSTLRSRTCTLLTFSKINRAFKFYLRNLETKKQT